MGRDIKRKESPMTSHVLLDSLLQALREQREKVKSTLTLYKLAREEFDRQNEALLVHYEKEKDEQKELEVRIKSIALEMYLEDPERRKEVHEYVKERTLQVLTYREEEALEWCLAHRLFLQVDKKALETYIRSLKGKGVPEFVKVREEHIITIAQEL